MANNLKNLLGTIQSIKTKWKDRDEFFIKAYSYLLFFNYERENTNKDNKSPYQLLKEKEPHLCDKILNLPPIRLEWLAEEMKGSDYKSVCCLPLLPTYAPKPSFWGRRFFILFLVNASAI